MSGFFVKLRGRAAQAQRWAPQFEMVLLRILISLLMVVCFDQTLKAQSSSKLPPPSKFCQDVLDETVILEVSELGSGMIWPNFFSYLFFRLRSDGQVVYDVRTKTGVVRKSLKINSEHVDQVITLLKSKDLSDAQIKYPMLTSMKDAVLKTCVNFRVQDDKKILLVNYQPSHAKAHEYYPEALRQLLSKISAIRPHSKYELRYGLGKPGIP